MAGHNKWSKIKRKKGANDARRSKIWARITRDILVAAREGGGDPGMNARLALAVDKAKAENMPKENIERAIKRGTGEIEGADYHEISYEGYGPGGVAFFVEVLTDNTNRSVADVRHLFSKAGGNLGTTGSVAYLFERKGIIDVSAKKHTEDELFMIVADAGADDLELEDDIFTITTTPENFSAVTSALEAAGVEMESSQVERLPLTPVTLPPNESARVIRLYEALEENADVQAVYTNLDLDEAALEAVS